MKRELQLNELTPYLPYGLKCRFGTDEVYTIIGLINENVWLKEMTYGADVFDCKPILRPLTEFNGSDADEEINSNSNRGYISVDPKFYNLDGMFYNDVQILLKHHFDIFDLISSGLAIDMSTLPNPPKQ